jgi:cellulose synthase/poly-beta-1,6-N-acetylglucosamine synthase-like glycosyltransferase
MNRLGGNLVISGAFGLFTRKELIAAGGYLSETVGEDIELVMRLHYNLRETGTPYRVAYLPDPVAWTEVPESLKVLGRQRDRWHRGLADSLWRHRRMLFNPRFGSVGCIGMPYFFLVELLAPVVEGLGLLALALGLIFGAVNWNFALLFFLVAYGLGVAFSMFSILMEEAVYHRYQKTRDLLFLVLMVLVENLGYRQLTVFWRLRGLVSFLKGSKKWGEMPRKGFTET